MGFAQDLVNKGYFGYAGWGDAEAAADFRATGGSGKGGATPSSSASTPSSSSFTITQPSQPPIDVGAIAKQQLQLQQEANKPAIATLEAQKQPLSDRYKKLVEDIKARKGGATKEAEIATAREFGKRGVPLSSGAYDVALREAVTPVETQYGGLETQAVAGEQQDLMNLATQIASLQGGNVPGAFSTATQLATLQSELNRPQEVSTEVVTAGGRKLLVNKQTGATIADLGASETASSGTDLSSLLSIFGGSTGTTPTEPKPSYKPTSFSNTNDFLGSFYGNTIAKGKKGGFGATTQGFG